MSRETTTLPKDQTGLVNWTLALAYIGFIYSTLGIVPVPLAYLRAHGFLRYTLATLFLICWTGVLTLLASRSRQASRFLAMVVVAGLYATIARHVSTPEEQLHFVQYGLVGVLFVRAVRRSARREDISYLLAFLLAVLAGWLDEVIQGHVSNRHYDPHDIALNAASSFLGLIVYRLIPQRR